MSNCTCGQKSRLLSKRCCHIVSKIMANQDTSTQFRFCLERDPMLVKLFNEMESGISFSLQFKSGLTRFGNQVQESIKKTYDLSAIAANKALIYHNYLYYIKIQITKTQEAYQNCVIAARRNYFGVLPPTDCQLLPVRQICQKYSLLISLPPIIGSKAFLTFETSFLAFLEIHDINLKVR